MVRLSCQKLRGVRTGEPGVGIIGMGK